MACRLKSMKELAREAMKRKCQEQQEMEKTRQIKQQIFCKEAKEANHTLNEDGQEATKGNQMKAAKKSRWVPEKSFDVSLTIGIPGENVDEKVFDLLVNWLRAERIWRACTTPDAVEVADVETIFFGVETPMRYFETQEGKTTAQDEDANVHEDGELLGQDRQSRPGDEDGELPGQDHQSGPADDEEASTILVIELDKGLDTRANLDRLREALLEAGFAVGMKTTVKEENPMDHIPEYFRLWD
ncbi:hypothetical protein R1flu_001292 [Riccia fluitans]|uniref:Uncharacterized protein n=1 Tax=Riccia fluitans TaxID=41844 RepID=A0ABD1Y2W3_9MARC